MKEKTIYTLIKSDIDDAKVGGDKLIYNRVTYPVLLLNLYYFKVAIPLLLHEKKTGGLGIDIKKETVIYYRPYKSLWDTKRNHLPYHLWGKKNNRYTNMWLELEFDHQDIYKRSPIIKTRIDDQTLIKLLQKHTAKFVLYN
jgi:hypothetical protein